MVATYAPIDLVDVAAGKGGFAIRGDNSISSGWWVASAGDVNGDGFSDLLIGAPYDGAGARQFVGASYVIFGKAGSFAATIDLGSIAAGTGGFVIRGEDAFDNSGWSVSSAGDVNGDGFDDVVIGTYGGDAAGNAKPGAGDSYVVFGHDGGFAASIDLADIAAGSGGFVIHGEDAGDRSGWSVAAAGDVNGDGFDDLIVGAAYGAAAGNAKRAAGDSYVVFGHDGGFAAAIDLADIAAGSGGFVIHGEDEYDYSGWSTASAGDVNGDGFDDLIIGAPSADAAGNAKSAAGTSYVVFGKASGIAAAIDLGDIVAGSGGFVIHGEDAGDRSGWSVASTGDVNGDGFDDLIVDARGGDAAGNAKNSAGDSYVVFGKAGGFAAAIDLGSIAAGMGGFVIFGEDAGDRLQFFAHSGQSVASAGDMNGDGFDDLIIGATGGDAAGNAKSWAGDSYVVFGKAGGFAAAIDLASIAAGSGGFVIHGENADDHSGQSVASAGDVNGDGFDDLLIGASYADSYYGASYVVFGGAFQPGPAGTTGDDSLLGGAGAQGMDGGAGNDVLRGKDGNDTTSGGEGNDRLIGARGADVLSGGQGKDRFVFDDNALGAIDRILDFDWAEGDRIVLRAIDAVAGTPTDDAFTIIGTAAFSNTAGELRWGDIGRGVQQIEGDVNGDGVADLVIDVANDATQVAAGWLVL